MDITILCADALAMTKFPCISNDYGYPVMFVVARPDHSIAVAGENPTVAELQTAITSIVEADTAIVIEQITNGARVESALETEEGGDTADGLRTVFGTNIETSGKIKLLDEAQRAALAKLALYQRLRTWVITSGGYILGGKRGYRVANYIAPMFMEGFGTRAAHDVSFIHKHDMNATDPATQDDAYLDLVND